MAALAKASVLNDGDQMTRAVQQTMGSTRRAAHRCENSFKWTAAIHPKPTERGMFDLDRFRLA